MVLSIGGKSLALGVLVVATETGSVIAGRVRRLSGRLRDRVRALFNLGMRGKAVRSKDGGV